MFSSSREVSARKSPHNLDRGPVLSLDTFSVIFRRLKGNPSVSGNARTSPISKTKSVLREAPSLGPSSECKFSLSGCSALPTKMQSHIGAMTNSRPVRVDQLWLVGFRIFSSGNFSGISSA